MMMKKSNGRFKSKIAMILYSYGVIIWQLNHAHIQKRIRARSPSTDKCLLRLPMKLMRIRRDGVIGAFQTQVNAKIQFFSFLSFFLLFNQNHRRMATSEESYMKIGLRCKKRSAVDAMRCDAFISSVYLLHAISDRIIRGSNSCTNKITTEKNLPNKRIISNCCHRSEILIVNFQC